jgi:hypothetical protein
MNTAGTHPVERVGFQHHGFFAVFAEMFAISFDLRFAGEVLVPGSTPFYTRNSQQSGAVMPVEIFATSTPSATTAPGATMSVKPEKKLKKVIPLGLIYYQFFPHYLTFYKILCFVLVLL